MRQGVLPLNIIVSVLYIIFSAATLFALKKSSRSLKIAPKTQKLKDSKWQSNINYSKIIALSWAKKYTLIGTFIHEDKKYLLK